jgi:hypothetical protein
VLHDITILHIYILFTYFASFIVYEDYILEVISNLHVQGGPGSQFVTLEIVAMRAHPSLAGPT